MKALSLLICVLLLNACSGSFYLASGGAAGAPQLAAANPASGPAGLRANINTSPGPWFSALILGVLLADGADAAGSMGQSTRAVAPPDESRKISVQDCSRPVDLSLGNLSCR
jgi:hypothetical protein